MSKSYRPYLPDQEFLLPPSLRDWLPENHLVYFVSDVIDNLNLSDMDAVYSEEHRGQPPYDPRMMTKLLIYGYCVGVFSSRHILQRLAEDIAFRVLAAGNAPNFRHHLGFPQNPSGYTGKPVRTDTENRAGSGCDEVGAGGVGWHESEGQCQQAQGNEL